jgi:hypothetical protein
MKRSRADLFKHVGAPLHNPQWSWGAERPSDNVLFLVVWQDESMRRDGKYYSLILNQTHWGDRTDSNGLNERKRHLERVRQGAKTYLVMALSQNARAPDRPRTIDSVNADEVFEGGELFEDEHGDVWIERRARIPIDQAGGC